MITVSVFGNLTPEEIAVMIVYLAEFRSTPEPPMIDPPTDEMPPPYMDPVFP